MSLGEQVVTQMDRVVNHISKTNTDLTVALKALDDLEVCLNQIDINVQKINSKTDTLKNQALTLIVKHLSTEE